MPTQGAAGLKKHGVGSSSAAVHGFRYNARVLARHIAEKLGVSVPRQTVARRDIVPFLQRELTRAPELWAQKSYLARVVYEDGETAVVPLTDFIDHPRSGMHRRDDRDERARESSTPSSTGPSAT